MRRTEVVNESHAKENIQLTDVQGSIPAGSRSA
eukprot:CAMPEP_0197553108 /NCGR_PEP_ID=MMETSP1320-20131121/8132_1 /TAXON_ID=91990 /ORGANISM="Bolidomonas sp., Strain RCC2347" /LENGTH=32 /DNA_ID= /DNA_START= /DNA_END= /DNA_ORIENTATION=